ncbi:MAG: hypothetical protein LQ342_006502 [Letrouitia transgressa]|nr:MAG: hypothetical protein LQ342_006502 [Letrouitia transgressa]
MSVLRHTPDPAAVANTYTYDKLEPAVRQLIDLWEQEPLYIGTEAHKRAKVRLIRDLLNQGKLDEAVERGILTVANCVREQAEDATFVGENGENVWHFPGPELIKMKELRLEGFERTIDLKAQTLVGEAEGTPQWRLDFENWEKENRERNRTKREMMQKRKERRQKRRKQKRRQKEEAAEAQTNKQIAIDENEESGEGIQLDSLGAELEAVEMPAVDPLVPGSKTFNAELPFRPH